METNLKRLFFAIEINTPWPEDYPPGRILDVENRHLTLAFLGCTDPEMVFPLLSHFPQPNFKLGLVGEFIDCIFLPPKRPHVAAWEIKWLKNSEQFFIYQKSIEEWLEAHKVPFAKYKKEQKFLPHVTIARDPKNFKKWTESFSLLPVIAKGVHLFESKGHSQYKSLWKRDFILPFEEIEHTADIGFKIHGESFNDLFLNASIALAFKFPIFLKYLQETSLNNLDEVVRELNRVVAQIDSNEGSPIKAVSYHGKAAIVNNVLQWEMIVDV